MGEGGRDWGEKRTRGTAWLRKSERQCTPELQDAVSRKPPFRPTTVWDNPPPWDENPPLSRAGALQARFWCRASNHFRE